MKYKNVIYYVVVCTYFLILANIFRTYIVYAYVSMMSFVCNQPKVIKLSLRAYGNVLTFFVNSVV